MKRNWPPALYISDTACVMRIVEIVRGALDGSVGSRRLGCTCVYIARNVTQASVSLDECSPDKYLGSGGRCMAGGQAADKPSDSGCR